MDKQNNIQPKIHQLPDDLNAIWNQTAAITPEKVVSEAETESALNDIWAAVETEKSSGKSRILRFAVAASIILVMFVGVINFYSRSHIAPTGEISTIELPDGSSVQLTSNSTISYSLLFGITNRAIQFEGQAIFEVESNEALPFVINSPTLTTEVLGTVFEVNDWNDAELTESSVYVYEGKVSVSSSNRDVVLTDNESAVLSISSGLEKEVFRIEEQQLIDWTDQRFNFQNTPINILFERLSLHYGVEIELENNLTTPATVSGSYSFNTSLDKILSDISMIKNLNILETHNGYSISE